MDLQAGGVNRSIQLIPFGKCLLDQDSAAGKGVNENFCHRGAFYSGHRECLVKPDVPILIVRQMIFKSTGKLH